jgi:hypothetical protein
MHPHVMVPREGVSVLLLSEAVCAGWFACYWQLTNEPLLNHIIQRQHY